MHNLRLTARPCPARSINRGACYVYDISNYLKTKHDCSVFIEVLRQCDDNGERTEPIVHLFVACDHYGLVDLRGCVLIKEFKIFFILNFCVYSAYLL